MKIIMAAISRHGESGRKYRPKIITKWQRREYRVAASIMASVGGISAYQTPRQNMVRHGGENGVIAAAKTAWQRNEKSRARHRVSYTA